MTMPKDLAGLKAHTMGGMSGVAQGSRHAVFMRDYFNIMFPVLRSSVEFCDEILTNTGNTEACAVMAAIAKTIAAMFSRTAQEDYRSITAIGDLLQRVADAGDAGRLAWGLFSSHVMQAMLSVPMLFPEFALTLPDDPDSSITACHIGLTGVLSSLPDELRRPVLDHLVATGDLSSRLDLAALRRSREATRAAVQSVMNKAEKRAAENE